MLFSQSQLNNYRSGTSQPELSNHRARRRRHRLRDQVRLRPVPELWWTQSRPSIPISRAQRTPTAAIAKYVKRANALQKILSAAYSFITTQDDMIGNAIEDVVVGQFFPGANWIVKGESNKTNGWLKLEMR